jgi:uncharacterized OB-fold protein
MEKATIYSYSILFSSSEAFKDKTPYLTAILENEKGERFASLVDGYKNGASVAIGQEVRCTGKDAQGKAVYSL